MGRTSGTSLISGVVRGKEGPDDPSVARPGASLAETLGDRLVVDTRSPGAPVSAGNRGDRDHRRVDDPLRRSRRCRRGRPRLPDRGAGPSARADGGGLATTGLTIRNGAWRDARAMAT